MRWNNTYDIVIVQCLLQCGYNLPKAFDMVQRRMLSEYGELVSKKAVSSRYYRMKAKIEERIEDLIEEAKEEKIALYYKESRKPWYMKLWKAVQSMLNINQRL